MDRHTCSQFIVLQRQVVWIVAITVGCIFWATCSVPPVLAGEPPAKLLDCAINEVLQPDLTLSLTVANFSFATGEELSEIEDERVAWSNITQGLATRYVELCKRYNLGDVDKKEYRDGLRDLEEYYRVAKKFEERLLENRDTRMQESIGGIDGSQTRSFGERTRQALTDPLSAFAKEVAGLGALGGPLRPRRPTEAPDILGSPGVKPDVRD